MPPYGDDHEFMSWPQAAAASGPALHRPASRRMIMMARPSSLRCWEDDFRDELEDYYDEFLAIYSADFLTVLSEAPAFT